MVSSIPFPLLFLLSSYFYLMSFFALFINRYNPFLVLIISELQLVLIISFMSFWSFIYYLVFGLVFALFIIAFAGAEASVGISLLISFYRLRGVLSSNPFESTRGLF